MDFDLPKEVRLVRRSVREFAEQTIAPLVEEMEQRDEFPAPLVKAMGEHRGARARDPGRARRLEPRVPGAHGGRRGGQPGLGGRRHQPPGAPHGGRRAGRVRQRRPEGEVPAGPLPRRLPRHLRDHRADRRLRPARHGQHRPARRRRLRAQRPQVLHHQLPPERRGGHVAKTGEGPKGISAFVVEKGTPGFSAGRHEHKLGLRGADTGELIFRDCQVPRENLIGNEGDGMTIALKTISEVGRAGMAAVVARHPAGLLRRGGEVRQGAHALRPADRPAAGDPVEASPRSSPRSRPRGCSATAPRG